MTHGAPIGVGIAGASLTPAERELLARISPWAIILFRRNLETFDGIADLVGEIRRLPGPPRLCVDQEGGPVDRFRDLLGPSISFHAAARRREARRAGELAGEACARLGFDVDLAPVVDRLLPGASENVLRDRCASADPAEVSRAASDFLGGLRARGVGGCVKHFPGLGRAGRDTHRELPVIPEDPGEESNDLAPFRATMEGAGAVMVSHAAGADGAPASLSREKATDLLRGRLHFAGVAFSDDLEMGALSAFGSLAQRCVDAMRAGCDLVFVCSRSDQYEECVAALERDVPSERLTEAFSRLARYGRHLDEIRRTAALPERPLEALVADIRALASP